MPGHLSDDDIDAHVREVSGRAITATASGARSCALTRACAMPSAYETLSRRALNPRRRSKSDVYPDRSHAQSGDPEIPARTRRPRRAAPSICRSREAAGQSPLAARLFDIPNIGGVFFGSDFISVTKIDGEWQQIKPAVLGAIMEHYLSGAPLLADESAESMADADEFFDEKDAETVTIIKDLIETRVRPAVAGDGGDITFKGYKEGVVFLHMKGACSGCPSSTATLKHGIQNLLRHFVPDVVEVRPV